MKLRKTLKKIIAVIMAAAFMLGSCMLASAETGNGNSEILSNTGDNLTEIASGTCGENLTWVLDTDGKLTISGSGEMDNFESSNWNDSTSPWFEYKDSIKMVEIQSGVKNIGNYAFSYCFNLNNIIVATSVMNIGQHAFYYCGSLQSITIPEGVTSIGDSAFSHCEDLSSIVIPESVMNIGSYAFEYCHSLNGITFSEGATLGEKIFNGCLCEVGPQAGICGMDGDNLKWTLDVDGKLTIWGSGEMDDFNKGGAPWLGYTKAIKSIEIKEGVTSIGNSAFLCCDKITDIVIPEGVTEIEFYAFEGCTSLTEVTLPNSLVDVYRESFCETPFFDDAKKDGAFTILDGILMDGSSCSGDVIVPDGVKKIAAEAFYRCNNMTSIILPEGITSIGNHAFDRCSSLSSITIPESVTCIGNSAFSWCTSLSSITIPEGVTSIGYGTFYECKELSDINIPKSVIYIKNESPSPAFYNTKWLENQKEKSTYVVVNGILIDVDSGSCRGDVVVPEGIISIGGDAFSNCDNLTSVTIPEGVTSIGRYAFSNCDNLTSVTIPESINEIALDAFYSCNNLSNISVSENVLSKVGMSAFSGSKWFTEQNEQSGQNYPENFVVIDGVLNSVSNCSGSIVIPEGIRAIGDRAFEYCDDLTSVTIPEGVKSIGKYAFYSCDNLTSVTLPKSLTSIGGSAFNDCDSLSTIILPENLTSIGNAAFAWCDSLTNIVIPEGIENIGYGTFYYCNNLETVTLPIGLKTVGIRAFAECSNLTNVNISESIMEIEACAFKNCALLSDITIPESTTVGVGAFWGCPKLNGRENGIGDVNGDGSITAEDALSILKHVVGLEILTGEALTSADVNADNVITAEDALDVLKKVVGLINTFKAEQVG